MKSVTPGAKKSLSLGEGCRISAKKGGLCAPDIRLCKLLLRVVENLFGYAMLDQFAQPQERHMIREAARLPQGVRHQHNCVMFLEREQAVLDVPCRDRIERRRRFIA